MADAEPTVFVVSHFHWDREWYRTMQAFRARLVDAIDQVLALADADADGADNDADGADDDADGADDDADGAGFRFVLDGQTVVVEDYFTARPDRRDDLVRHVQAGRLAIGPWYVQPDSLMPSGEAHIRNLLEGRRSGVAMGPVSQVGYVPDSFGHPAQFPQLLAGFGLAGFVHWRGNGTELDRLGPRWRWRAPDGSEVPVFHLSQGYFGAARPPDDAAEAVAALAQLIETQRKAGEHPVIVMNGFDHTRPDAGIGDVIAPLAAAVGLDVVRGTLDDALAAALTATAVRAPAPTGSPESSGSEWTGELVGGRIANLLPGVWSTRAPLKLRNRRCETLLEAWAEPWAALGRALGATDESAALREAWRKLLRNQAHDSICGCSIDAVHERMAARFDDAEGLAAETLDRVLERVAGRNADRDVPSIEELELAVFNASPHPVTGIVRVPLDAHPALAVRVGAPEIHWLVSAGLGELGLSVDGAPARVVASTDPTRVRWLTGQKAYDVEFVAHDVPAFGWRRYRVEQAEPVPDAVDDGRQVTARDLVVAVAPDGTLDVAIGEHRWTGLFGVEDVGDRGDSYDHDPVGEPRRPDPVEVSVVRHRHPSGIERLVVRRVFELPAGLDPDDDGRAARSARTVEVPLELEVVVAPAVPGVRVAVRLTNTACDHRLRLRFPTGRATSSFAAATTFDEMLRSTDPVDDRTWVHPAPTTFCSQGHVTVGGLTVMAPGLHEAEVRPDGEVLVTLVRSVGWLSRSDLTTRPFMAGPEMPTPGAQCLGEIDAEVVLAADAGPALVREAMVGLRGVVAGPEPMVAPGVSLLELRGDDAGDVVLSALKPAAGGSDGGDGVVVRVLNPTGRERPVELAFGLPLGHAASVRLDETPDGRECTTDGDSVRFVVGAHELRSLRVGLDSASGVGGSRAM